MNELERAMRTMNRAVECLELELPHAVFEDVLAKWNDVKQHVMDEALEES